MNSRRVFFWILLFFTLFVVYESVLGPLLERLLRDSDVAIVASKKVIKPQGFALPLLIYFVWRTFKWSRPERVEEERIKEEKIEEERIGKNGYTKLMHLSGSGEIQEIQKLLTLSLAQINAQDKGGYTALMHASSGGHLRVVELLIGLGANKKLMTKKGNDALFFAKNNSHTEIISILQSEFPKSNGGNSPQSNTNQADESPQPSAMSTEEKIADFERRLNYKAQPLSEEAQDRLEAKFRSAARLKKWPE
jgi:ankyrin repeat protein